MWPNQVHYKIATDTPIFQVDGKKEEIHNYKINDGKNVNNSNNCDTNETNKLQEVQVRDQINVRNMPVVNVDGKKEDEIMSNQVKDQIYVRTVPTSIDFDKKEANQNCKIKNIETNSVDTLETVKCNIKDTDLEYYSKNQVTTNLVDIQFNKTFRRIATRGLAFRGDNETIGSKFNGNYLGCLKLLSNRICDEFIDLMSKTVLQCIVKEIKVSKYFSIIVDSTPDVTKVDQLTVAVRYICKDGLPVERIIGFLPSVGHKAQEMELELLKLFKNLDIDMINCRAEFVPCSAHSLNLVGTFAAELTRSELCKKALKLVEYYVNDLEVEFVEEIVQFKKYITNFPIETKNMQGMLKYLINNPSLNTNFPNVKIALKLFICTPCSNASGERSFSVLKRVKNYLWSSLSNEKTSALSILCIENEIVKNINWTSLVKKFSELKARKKNICINLADLHMGRRMSLIFDKIQKDLAKEKYYTRLERAKIRSIGILFDYSV
ncbi:hypothetical protein QTP88_009231 [Uroleucon formosanum]